MRALELSSETAAHWSAREYDALFAPEAPPRIALVAAEGDELRGFIIARCGWEWEIENVVVAREHRRRGIGSELVRELLRAAQKAGAAAVLLEVRESNVEARQLYERLEFTEVGRRPGYYCAPVEDALVLSLSIYNCDKSA